MGEPIADDIPESELLRMCSGLYVSFASEALSNLFSCGIFAYLVLFCSTKGHLRSPAVAVARLLRKGLRDWYKDFAHTISRWPDMNTELLEARFKFCTRISMHIYMISGVMSFLSLTRLLHYGNVDGARYLGWAITCPLLQGELLVLVSPLVRGYRTVMVVMVVVTACVMLSGWAGSVIAGPLHYGSVSAFLQSGNFDDLQLSTKFWVVLPSFAAFFFLCLYLLPYLLLVYFGPWMEHEWDMPKKFPSLVALVVVSWVLFPVWWVISPEGLSLITDTKLNGWGFAILNFGAKVSFTRLLLHVMDVSRPRRQVAGQFRSATVPYWLQILSEYDSDGGEEEADEIAERNEIVRELEVAVPSERRQSTGSLASLGSARSASSPSPQHRLWQEYINTPDADQKYLELLRLAGIKTGYSTWVSTSTRAGSSKSNSPAESGGGSLRKLSVSSADGGRPQVPSQDLTGLVIDEVAMYSERSELPWDGIAFDFREFLVLAGVTAMEWNMLSEGEMREAHRIFLDSDEVCCEGPGCQRPCCDELHGLPADDEWARRMVRWGPSDELIFFGGSRGSP